MPLVRIVYRPLTLWENPTPNRRSSPFSAPWPDTLDLLDREVAALGAREAVLQAAFGESEIRRDGYPRANARPSHPGVAINFESKFGALRYATDTFHDWQANVRAIALGLEALRKVDRYAISKRGEQYAGWKALPSSTGPTLSVEDAAVVIANASGTTVLFSDIVRDRAVATRAIRAAQMRTHPDHHAGDSSAFDRVQAARGVLMRHHHGGPA